MHVADHERSLPLEYVAALRSDGKQTIDHGPIRYLGGPDVDNGRARLDVRGRDESRSADRRDEDVTFRSDARQIHRSRVTDRDGRVDMQEKERHRLTDDVAAPDDDGVRTGDVDARPFQQLDDPRRRTRRQGRPALHEPPYVDRMKTVDVLRGIDRVEHTTLGVGAHRRRERRLHEDAIVNVARVQTGYDRQQFVERRRRRQPLEIGSKPDLPCRFQFVPYVDG